MTLTWRLNVLRTSTNWKETQTIKLHVGKIVVVKRECLPAPCPLIFFLSNMKLNRHCRGQSSNSVHCCLRIAHNCDNNISSLHFVVQRGEFHIFHSVFYLPRVIMNLHDDQLSVDQKTRPAVRERWTSIGSGWVSIPVQPWIFQAPLSLLLE